MKRPNTRAAANGSVPAGHPAQGTRWVGFVRAKPVCSFRALPQAQAPAVKARPVAQNHLPPGAHGRKMPPMKTHGMRVWLCAGLLLGAAGMPAESKAPAGKWELLFNGKDLTGWAPVHEVTFTVHEGNLRLVKGMGWLRTEKEYKDFILEFEWRALEEKYDSGVFFRAGLDGKPWPKDGWQLNLLYDAIGGLVRGYRPVVPSETPRIPPRQWVKFRLEVCGKKATLDVNGERAWESDAIDRDRGYIGIQAENKQFDFRNFRLLQAPEEQPGK